LGSHADIARISLLIILIDFAVLVGIKNIRYTIKLISKTIECIELSPF